MTIDLPFNDNCREPPTSEQRLREDIREGFCDRDGNPIPRPTPWFVAEWLPCRCESEVLVVLKSDREVSKCCTGCGKTWRGLRVKGYETRYTRPHRIVEVLP